MNLILYRGLHSITASDIAGHTDAQDFGKIEMMEVQTKRKKQRENITIHSSKIPTSFTGR